MTKRISCDKAQWRMDQFGRSSATIMGLRPTSQVAEYIPDRPAANQSSQPETCNKKQSERGFDPPALITL